jgi:hypothetical protein
MLRQSAISPRLNRCSKHRRAPKLDRVVEAARSKAVFIEPWQDRILSSHAPLNRSAAPARGRPCPQTYLAFNDQLKGWLYDDSCAEFGIELLCRNGTVLIGTFNRALHDNGPKLSSQRKLPLEPREAKNHRRPRPRRSLEISTPTCIYALDGLFDILIVDCAVFLSSSIPSRSFMWLTLIERTNFGEGVPHLCDFRS